ncbi:MAG: hypothetical protein HYZ72_14715 [Deltaproteobacteria bacterium]|nr:hypothetical protein [Deltaproteobacteria bacterium]
MKKDNRVSRRELLAAAGAAGLAALETPGVAAAPLPSALGKWQVLRNIEGEDKIAEVLAVHAALLHTGKVLYFGGDEHDPNGNIDHTRLWNPLTPTLPETVGSPTMHDLFCCGHTMLGDGSVLVAGGTEGWDVVPDPYHGDHFRGRG